MELLSQRKVHALKQEETRQAIQKGMELANRIDSLRTISLEEEKNLNEQRDSIINSLKKEANELNDQIFNARTELNRIYEQKKEALKPLTDRWEELNRAESAFNLRIAVLEEERSEIFRKERILQHNMDQADHNFDLSLEMKDESEVLLKRRKLQLEEVERITFRLNSDIDRFNQSRDMHNSQFAERERRLQIRERELEIKVENLNKRERELNLNHVNNGTANH